MVSMAQYGTVSPSLSNTARGPASLHPGGDGSTLLARVWSSGFHFWHSLSTIISLKKSGFKRCNSERAEIPFDNILDRVTGSDPSVLESPAKCPTAGAIFWKKLSLSLHDVLATP